MDKTRYCGLIFKCPFGTQTETCPYRHLRNLSKFNSYRLYEKLDDELVKDMVDKHKICYKEREDEWRKDL